MFKKISSCLAIAACLLSGPASSADSDTSKDLERQSGAAVYGDSTSPGGTITYSTPQQGGTGTQSGFGDDNASDCSAQTLTWGSCSATSTPAGNGTSQSLTNTNSNYNGTATATCSNGSFSLSNTTCTAASGSSCTGVSTGNVSWTTGGHSCSGIRTDGFGSTVPDGSTARWEDFPTSNCPSPDNTGYYAVTCNNGTLSSPSQACYASCTTFNNPN